ncbi:retrovirus-related pol polyprotein from transposon TNT 1-94, partial [Tanacetum coccineum]
MSKNQPPKVTVPSSKEDNILMSNSYAALDEESDEDVENVYDKSANLLHSTQTGGSSSTFTVAAGFIDVDHPSHVYKLKKALYGLKQAPRAWYDKWSKFLQQNHFNKGIIDPTLFIRRFDDDILVVQVYVDDIIFGSTNPRYTHLFADLMKSRFEMSMMGEMTFFLGLQVNQSPRGIFINQSNYVLEILKKYGMETCDPVGTPMEIKDKLDLDKNGTLVDATKYRSMIGALMYLTSSRPDIVHATCLCARYQAKPTEKHLKEVKRIFRYLRGTVNI